MSIPSKKIVICGATGFIGRNMVEYFATRPGYEVTAIHHHRPPYDCPGVRWISADLTNNHDVERCLEGADILVQAAATTSGSKDILSRPYIHVTDNAVMNSLLFRAAFLQKIQHVVFFSCSIMLQSSETPWKEEDFNANQELVPAYFGAGWTKVYLEKMCEFFSRQSDVKFTAIRHTNIYGPYDKYDLDRSHFFGATITKVMTARDGKLVVWGKGEEKRDLLYVADLVDFVERVIERQRQPFSLYNCGYGQAVAIKDVTRKIVERSGLPLTIEHDLSKQSIPTYLSLDCSKAEKELGWKVRTTLEEGIDLTINWWKQQIGKKA
ncbi:MAG: NAD(P)-dependent oxidoreductase [Magnetococcales bacterium]|nr:NAD(P)-dependent oxidoreductase [Magnetococcales bacterium]